MRLTLTLCTAALALAACAGEPPAPKDQYFDRVNPDLRGLEGQNPASTTDELARLEGQISDEVAGNATANTAAVGDNPEISQTQDFEVVTSTATIESDAARLESLRDQYVVVDPQALPQRGDQVNLAAYALSQKQPIGTQIYERRRGRDGCRRYEGQPELAQRVFLERGGPFADRGGLDRDGDGFACGWNPDQYRLIQQETAIGGRRPSSGLDNDPLGDINNAAGSAEAPTIAATPTTTASETAALVADLEAALN